MNEPHELPPVSLHGVVLCPNCGEKYSKCLYDWQFIYCTSCRIYFEKHTGKRIECTRPPEQYWHTDSETQNPTGQTRPTDGGK